MPAFNLRLYLKKSLPRPMVKALRHIETVYNRICIWPIILWQVRGATMYDKLLLYCSAAASPCFALFNLNDWQDPVLLADINVKVANIGSFHLRKRTDDLYHVTPWREKAVVNCIRSTLKVGDVFVDAGANIGFYTVLASRIVGSSGKVYCVEMMPDTADQLERNIRINSIKNATIIRKALSNHSNQEIVANVEPGRYGRASVSVVHSKSTNVLVTSTTLDEILDEVGFVQLMKMDIEGAEFQALNGAKSLEKKIGKVIYENWTSDYNKPDLVGEYLKANSFDLVRIDGNNNLAVKNELLSKAHLR
jgi:FkbM family methyltransferase